jgi:hypothetical protein
MKESGSNIDVSAMRDQRRRTDLMALQTTEIAPGIPVCAMSQTKKEAHRSAPLVVSEDRLFSPGEG